LNKPLETFSKIPVYITHNKFPNGTSLKCSTGIALQIMVNTIKFHTISNSLN